MFLEPGPQPNIPTPDHDLDPELPRPVVGLRLTRQVLLSSHRWSGPVAPGSLTVHPRCPTFVSRCC